MLRLLACRSIRLASMIPPTYTSPGNDMAVPSMFHQPVRRLPVCTVQTNLGSATVPSDFMTGLAKVIARTLNKPEELISVSMTTNVTMVRAGSDSGTAVVEIWSIGVFDTERNKQYTSDLYTYLTTSLRLPADRIVLLFHPLQPHDAGHLIYSQIQQQK
jgi:hypothetical protein